MLERVAAAVRRRPKAVAALVAVALVIGLVSAFARSGDTRLYVGRPPPETTVAPAGPTIVVPEVVATSEEEPASPTSPGLTPEPEEPGDSPVPARPPAEPSASPILRRPDASPYGDAIPFVSDVPVRSDLVFILVAGSDARPGEDVQRTRADSIHLLAVNPRSGGGTVLGLPRDSFVEIPGHGRQKINNALAIGGPDLLAETVRRVTGLPVDYWVLTGFNGLEAIVDDLGGIIVPVDRRMADPVSGAFFDRGNHNMSGRDALAFSRNRKDTPQGDFTRSAHQGDVILAALAKMRVEVGDTEGLRRWTSILLRHASLDVGADDLAILASTARRMDPRSFTNVVAPGAVGMAGRQSVVYLSREAAPLFMDLRDDATIGSAPAPTTTTAPPARTSPTSTSTSTSAPLSAPASTTTTTPRPPPQTVPTTSPPTTAAPGPPTAPPTSLLPTPLP